MNLLLNEEQTLLRNSAQAFFTECLPVSNLRKLRDERNSDGFDRAAWQRAVDMGWAGILVGEDYGGADFGYVGFGQVLEAAGRTLAATPLVASALLGAPLIMALGKPAQKAAALEALVRGDRLFALAVDESPRHQPSHIALHAEREGGTYILEGSKSFVLDGHIADQIIVVARSTGAPDAAHGISLFLVDADSPGLQRNRTLMVDSRNAARLVFDKVRVPADCLLGTENEAFTTLDTVLDGARAGLAAEMLGSGLEAFERTLAYLRLRQQFGVAIGSFQALKHRAALMYCELELTRSAVLAALVALDTGDSNSAELASLAKAKACDMLELVSNEAVQMHGGIGMTDAEEIGLFLKRARVQQQMFGDAAFHRDRYARLKGF